LAKRAMRAICKINQPRWTHFIVRRGPIPTRKAAAQASAAGCLARLRIVSQPRSTTLKGLGQNANSCDIFSRWTAAMATKVARRSANSISFGFMIGI
jgi:hypothetical protein